MMAFDVQNGAKGMRLPHLRNGIFFEFSLCLSRACLGKMFVFMYKWLKNAVFRRPSLQPQPPPPSPRQAQQQEQQQQQGRMCGVSRRMGTWISS
jgi:hypothetical protein